MADRVGKLVWIYESDHCSGDAIKISMDQCYGSGGMESFELACSL